MGGGGLHHGPVDGLNGVAQGKLVHYLLGHVRQVLEPHLVPNLIRLGQEAARTAWSGEQEGKGGRYLCTDEDKWLLVPHMMVQEQLLPVWTPSNAQ